MQKRGQNFEMREIKESNTKKQFLVTAGTNLFHD